MNSPQKKRLKILPTVLIAFAVLLLGFFVYALNSFSSLTNLGLTRLTGFPGAANYLVVFQNDAERRPTGGFITAYATLSFHGGIPWLSFGDVYDANLIQPGTTAPLPEVAELIGGEMYPGHGFRDGNVDPDWPTTAKELIRLYQLGYPDAEFDGVIAVNFSAFESLVDEFDPKMSAYGGLFHRVESEVQSIDFHDPDAIAERKNVLPMLARRLAKNILTEPGRWPDVAANLQNSLDEKNIQLFFRDPVLQSRARERGWTGELPLAGEGDLLAIVEGNYGGMKSSRYLVSDIDYSLEFDDADGLSAVADLKIKIDHRGEYAEPISGYYKSFWRVYSPLGTRLLAGEVDREWDDGARQVYGIEVDMQPGESREINLKYELPASVIVGDEYELQIFRQSGGRPARLRVTADLPDGYLADSDDFAALENFAIFDGLLDRDRDLELKLIPDTTPPRISWHEFRNGIDEIDLRFAEPLDPDSVAAATFAIRDENFRNDSTDSVEIIDVDFIAPQNIRLKLKGVTEECREWFELTLDGVADTHGNKIENRKMRVVQWLDSSGENCDPDRQL